MKVCFLVSFSVHFFEGFLAGSFQSYTRCRTNFPMKSVLKFVKKEKIVHITLGKEQMENEEKIAEIVGPFHQGDVIRSSEVGKVKRIEIEVRWIQR